MQRLEEATSRLMYHGTSTRFLRSILKKGLVPNPKKQRWGKDMDSTRQNVQPVATLDGYVYLAKSGYLARDIAIDAAKKFGGQPLVAVAQVSLNSLAVDHDDLTGPVNDAIWSIAKKRAPGDEKSRKSWLLGWLLGVETGRKIAVGDEFGKILKDYIGDDGKNPLKFKKGRGEGVKPYLPAKILMMYLVLAHRRQGNETSLVKGYLDAQQVYWPDNGYDMGFPAKDEEWTSEDRENLKYAIEKTKRQWPRNLSKSDLEDEWRETIAHVSDRLSGALDSERGRTKGAMIDDPLNYRGSNRIVALVEINGEPGEQVAVVHYSSLGRSSLESAIDNLGVFSSVEMARERVTESHTLVERIERFVSS